MINNEEINWKGIAQAAQLAETEGQVMKIQVEAITALGTVVERLVTVLDGIDSRLEQVREKLCDE